MDDSNVGYKPDQDFEENTKDPLVDISLTDSTELWLIQWPINKLKPADFQGKELSLKLHRDGKLGSFECSSGKSYDVVSFAAQEPDATVFLPSTSESKVVGKISRRVCLVRYPEPEEYEKPGLSTANISSQMLEGSRMQSRSHRSTLKESRRRTQGTSRDTLTSAHTIRESSPESPRPSRKKKRDERMSELSAKSAERSSRGSKPESHITDASLGSDQTQREKSKKKKKLKAEE